jgi:hypothetical protein
MARKIRPGGAGAGKLTLTGNYAPTASATLEAEIGGLTAGAQFDQLAVSGTAAMGGSLALSKIGGFQPAAGDTFAILTAPGGISGRFAGITGGNAGNGLTFAVIYDAAQVRAVATVAGDSDGDGEVTFYPDAWNAVANIGLTPATWQDGDYDGSGTVEFLDAFNAVANIGWSAH